MSNLVAVDGIPAPRLAEICMAELEGRLVVLPAPIGGTIYIPWACKDFDSSIDSGVEEHHLSGYIREGEREFYTTYDDMGSGDIPPSDLYLTREEAELNVAAKILEAEQEAHP